MNKIFLPLLTPLLMLTGAGCSKLLDVPGNAGAQIITSQVFVDSINAAAGVIGLYGGYSIFTSGDLVYYTGQSADELNSGISAEDTRFYTSQVSPGTQNSPGDAGTLWTEIYGPVGIFGANAAIEGINANKDSSLSANARNQLIGECKVLRALDYFTLVNLFGGVPLILSTDWRINSQVARSSADEVYGQVIKDLQDAAILLGPAYPSAGRQRPNRYVAMALLARVYLYRKQWDLAKAMADSVINSGLYSLVNNLDNVFLDQSTEAIWQIGSSDPTNPNQSPGTRDFVVSEGTVQMSLSPSLIAAFEPGDIRKDHWVKAALVLDFTTYQYTASQGQYKYRNTSSITAANGAEDMMIVRLAELYFIRAEAIARLGDPIGAMQDINVIRSRASLPPASASSLDDALGIILHERQVELFTEGAHRWFDLKRMDSVNAVMSRVKPQYWPADGHAGLYPISLSELIGNINLVQNPGY